MKNIYLFGELENIIFEIIEKAGMHPELLSEEEAKLLNMNTATVQLQILRELREHSLRKRDSEELRLFIRGHYKELIEYMNQVYLSFFKMDLLDNKHTAGVLLESLEEFRQLISEKFSECLYEDEKLPHYVLQLLKERLIVQREEVIILLSEDMAQKGILEIFLQILDSFIARIDGKTPMMEGETKYMMTVVDQIIRDRGKSPIVSDCPAMHELVVYWNLNDKNVITYFTHGIDKYISSLDTESEVVDWLMMEIKHIKSIPVMPEMIYDIRYPGVSDYFLSYLQNELDYRQQKQMGFAPMDAGQTNQAKFKVLCNLSSDQVGILLKGLDDLRIISAKSLSAVFKSIVPFLSTERKKELSWQSMRSKSLSGEDRDKDTVVEVLEKLSEHIRKS
jgi:hypothetical protein